MTSDFEAGGKAFARWLLEELDTYDGPSFASGGGGGRLYQADPKVKRAWLLLRDEIHDLICTNSFKYRKERAAFVSVDKPIVMLFGSLVTAHFGLEAATAGGLATLALQMPLKLGRNAWCEAYNASKKARDKNMYLKGERIILLEETGFKSDLLSKDIEKRKVAIQKIASNQLFDDDTVRLLAFFLEDNDAGIRGAAALALQSSGSLAEFAIPKFVACLGDPDNWVRTHATRALGHFPDKADVFLVQLTDRLEDDDTRVKEEAAEALGNLGIAAAASLPALKKSIKKEDPKGKSLSFMYGHTRLAGKLRSAISSIERAAGATDSS